MTRFAIVRALEVWCWAAGAALLMLYSGARALAVIERDEAVASFTEALGPIDPALAAAEPATVVTVQPALELRTDADQGMIMLPDTAGPLPRFAATGLLSLLGASA